GRKYSTVADPGPLGAVLSLDFAPGTTLARKPKGFFLRAETAYGVFEFMSNNNVPGYGQPHLLSVSHGESFLQVFEARFDAEGLYLLDEPEAALSFSSCLTLMRVLHDIGERGGQVICATHSPVLASLPGATVLQLSDAGIENVAWEELELVAHWRRYLAEPQQYLRHLL
ncbi:MAG TPA: AAA family ATPase, partial [Acidimicrobiales bacterium]